MRVSDTRMRSRSSPQQDGPTGWWLLTFNDLITLLLTFFVLLLAMSQVDAEKMQAISTAAREGFGITAVPQGMSGVVEPFVVPLQDRDIEAEKVKKAARQSLRRDAGTGIPSGEKAILVRSFTKIEGLEVKDVPEGLSVSAAASSFFPGRSEEIHAQGRRLLDKISDTLQGSNMEIRIESSVGEARRGGNVQGENGGLPIFRAVNIAEYFISRRIAPDRLSVIGYGEASASLPNSGQGSEMMHD
ncbi:MAG: flagellar motor protein MotB, partial [Pseudomonadota bacterium]